VVVSDETLWMMKTYIKYLVYYFLSLVDAVINFGCSIFRFYPGVEKATDFLVRLELLGPRKTITERNQTREEETEKAKGDVDLAISMLEEDVKYGQRL